MLVRRLKLKMDPGEIGDRDPLFGGALSLDSIDALEIVVGLQKEFDCVVSDKAVAEKVLVSVETMADFVETGKTG
ncbi:MAG TPA: acyl carrier protein [Deltaproteobacteria bacterium]|nr:acyl carrier protein [Deltaproteobacteria bacterium]